MEVILFDGRLSTFYLSLTLFSLDLDIIVAVIAGLI